MTESAARGTLRLYLDTNVLVEFRDFTEHPWPELVSEPEVVLVIAHTVVRELQQFKDGGGAGAVRRKRERAGRLLQVIENLFYPTPPASSGPRPVRRGVTAVYDLLSPSDDIYTQHQLDPKMGDGRLVATIMAAQGRGERACLVTNDYGARLLAKGFDLSVFDVPETWRLPVELDPTEQENQRLKKRLAEAESRLPKLSVRAIGGAQFITKVIPKPCLPVQEWVAAELDSLRFSYDTTRFGGASLNFAALGFAARGETSRYERDIEKFLTDAERMLPLVIEERNAIDLVLSIELELQSSGTAPGEKIEIIVSAPDGATLSTEPAVPKAVMPAHPAPPKASWDVLGGYLDQRVFMPSVQFPELRTEPRSPFRLDSDGKRLRIAMGTVRHDTTKPILPFYVALNSQGGVRSFSLDYEIHAHNLPQRTAGTIQVVAERGQKRSPLYPKDEHDHDEDHDDHGVDGTDDDSEEA